MLTIRCLKRYLASEVFYLLNPGQPADTQVDKQESIRGAPYTSLAFSQRPGPAAQRCAHAASERSRSG